MLQSKCNQFPTDSHPHNHHLPSSPPQGSGSTVHGVRERFIVRKSQKQLLRAPGVQDGQAQVAQALVGEGT